jgi:glycine dehydrogenase subunit 2
MRSTVPLLFELSHKGRRASDIPALDVPELDNLIPSMLLAGPCAARAFRNRACTPHTACPAAISALDNGSYPLGSCTMKYNPKINEELSNASTICTRCWRRATLWARSP